MKKSSSTLTKKVLAGWVGKQRGVNFRVGAWWTF